MLMHSPKISTTVQNNSTDAFTAFTAFCISDESDLMDPTWPFQLIISWLLSYYFRWHKLSPMEGSRNHPLGFGEIDSHMLSGMLPSKQTFAHDDDVSLYNLMGEWLTGVHLRPCLENEICVQLWAALPRYYSPQLGVAWKAQSQSGQTSRADWMSARCCWTTQLLL